jgi:hypothetical protein
MSYHIMSYRIICHIIVYVIYYMSYHIICHILCHIIVYVISYCMSIILYVISYYIPDRTEGFCVMVCEEGVKFRTLYPRRFFLLSLFDSGKGLEFLDIRIPLSVSRNTGAHLKYRLGTSFPG